jgi:hypothetical protein
MEIREYLHDCYLPLSVGKGLKLSPYPKGRTLIEGVWENSAEENILVQDDITA